MGKLLQDSEYEKSDAVHGRVGEKTNSQGLFPTAQSQLSPSETTASKNSDSIRILFRLLPTSHDVNLGTAVYLTVRTLVWEVGYSNNG